MLRRPPHYEGFEEYQAYNTEPLLAGLLGFKLKLFDASIFFIDLSHLKAEVSLNDNSCHWTEVALASVHGKHRAKHALRV